MKYWISHTRALLCSREFWQEYVFYMCYVAALWFVVQVMILHVEIHDYMAVLSLQIFSLLASAIVFVWLKTHYQPSNYRTKLWYFVLANGPWLWVIYYLFEWMLWPDLLIYALLMLLVTLIEWFFYDRMFDRCCDYAYRLKTLYRKRKHR